MENLVETCFLDDLRFRRSIGDTSQSWDVNIQGFGSAFFFADPDPVPDPDPDPGGILGRGLGVKGKNDIFLSFFHVSDDS